MPATPYNYDLNWFADTPTTMNEPTFADFFATGTGNETDYFSNPDYQNYDAYYFPTDGFYDSYTLTPMDTYADSSNAVPLSATDTPSSTGFWDSLGKALGDTFQTVTNSAAQAAGQNLAAQTAAWQKKINATVPPPAATAQPAASQNLLMTPTNAVLAVAVVALVVYLVAKKS